MTEPRSVTVTDAMGDAGVGALAFAADHYGFALPDDPGKRRAIAFAALYEGLAACPSPAPPELAAVVHDWPDPVTITLSRADAERMAEMLETRRVIVYADGSHRHVVVTDAIRAAFTAALNAAPAEGPERAATGELEELIAECERNGWAWELAGVPIIPDDGEPFGEYEATVNGRGGDPADSPEAAIRAAFRAAIGGGGEG